MTIGAALSALTNVQGGLVYLVGAGPGRADLVTLRGAALIASADLIAYDDLVNPALLSMAKADSELLAVGYRGNRGGAKAPTPEATMSALIAAAKAGKVVVRLKAGDPLILARGADEAMALTDAGIEFEFVPGITAALGAAAAAGIPLTHRGLTHGVRLISAHQPIHAGNSNESLVLYMARTHLAERCQDLIASGMPSSTPAAYVVAATTPAQRVIEATLADLPEQVQARAGDGPGLVIVGPTVGLRKHLQAANSGPKLLSGKRILVARGRAAPSRLAAGLRELGADVVEAPLVSALPSLDFRGFDRLVARLVEEGQTGVQASVLVFPCVEGVDGFFARLAALGLDARRLPPLPILAAPAASQRLLARGWLTTWILDGVIATACQRLASTLSGLDLLVISSDEGRPQLLEALAATGARTTAVAVYRYHYRWLKIVAPRPDLVVLPSSGAARLLLSADLGCPLAAISMVAIGAQTEAAARRAGATDVVRAASDTIEAVIAAAARTLTGAPTTPVERLRPPPSRGGVEVESGVGL